MFIRVYKAGTAVKQALDDATPKSSVELVDVLSYKYDTVLSGKKIVFLKVTVSSKFYFLKLTKVKICCFLNFLRLNTAFMVVFMFLRICLFETVTHRE